jgi:hypothetical protein
LTFNDLQTSVELCRSETGAGNEARTRDLHLGKVALYQLSYSRLGPVILVQSGESVQPPCSKAGTYKMHRARRRQPFEIHPT